MNNKSYILFRFNRYITHKTFVFQLQEELQKDFIFAKFFKSRIKFMIFNTKI